jgi:hypothetical protein
LYSVAFGYKRSEGGHMRPRYSCASLAITDLLNSSIRINGSSLAAVVKKEGLCVVR